LWVLSRTPQVSAETYTALVAQIEKLGYDPQRLRKTPQGTLADKPQK
jgi:lipocalin